jgi:signal transduction histidine kinase
MSSSADDTGENTLFAPSGRKSREEVVTHFNHIASNPLIHGLLDAALEALVILNRERQIVFANKALTLLAGVEDPRALCGLRLGEALDCVHGFEREEGCGTTEFCRTCGAVNAILNSQKGKADIQEFTISRERGSALDLRVKATPISIDGEDYTLFSAIDISDEKRRKALERIFFHDLLNTAGALKGFSEFLEMPSEEMERVVTTIRALSKRLLEEIAAQREFLAAEGNELVVEPGFVNSLECIEGVVSQYDAEPYRKKCVIRIDPSSSRTTFKSDHVLLRRVIGNLVKNAVEASRDGDVVTVGCFSGSGTVEFRIHNPAVMPEEVQLQVFQRSFSTKGSGRGLGTYSAKLLTERYLEGRISFTSSPDEGTLFRVLCPVDPSRRETALK